MPSTPTAREVARAMYARDRAAQELGVELLEVAHGYARMAMRVRENMLNGHAICHGGYIFALADTAFAYACNADNRVTLALSCHVSFTAPAAAGDRLVAEAEEIAAGGRTGVYDVTVRREDGTLIAVFRGQAYRTRAKLIGEEEASPERR